MRNATWILSTIFIFGMVGCAYNPALPDDPFLCGEGGKCPDGYDCYGGTCLKSLPPCMDPANPEFIGWPDDSDLEPNDHPSMAVVLPCGDDAVFSNPVDYVARCPSRDNYTNGFMNLLTCPNGDRDFYAIYMLPDEVVAFKILYQYNPQLPRDLNARVWREDPFAADPECPAGWNCKVAVGMSTNDNEEIEVSTASGSGNTQGWYYLEVFGKSYQDLNYYTVSFTLNASQI